MSSHSMPQLRSALRAVLGSLVVLLGVMPLQKPVRAQRPDSGTVIVDVRESMGMLDGFLVRSEGRSASTDATGRARLILPVGRQKLDVTRIGFVPKTITAVVVADSTISVTVDVEMQGMKMEEVAI